MTSPLIPEQRQRKIVRLLRDADVMSIRELTAVLGVSHMTVRRDLSALEHDGLVVPVQGGARLAGSGGIVPPAARPLRSDLNVELKDAIAREAAATIAQGMTVYLDAGTTCERLAEQIAGNPTLTVVTNDFEVVARLSAARGPAIIHTGGEVDAESGSSAGSLAARALEILSIDIAFLSAGSWDLEHGLTTTMTQKRVLKLAAMRASSRSVLLADSTKFGTTARFTVTPLDDLDAIITDDRLEPPSVRALRKAVPVSIASPPVGTGEGN